MLIAVMLGYWRYSVAKQTAEILFDRSLLATALAISRDVVISEGDSVSPATRKLMDAVANSPLYYHVTGPGGIYVTGYAYPPVRPSRQTGSPYEPDYFNARYRNEAVRVMRLSEVSQIDGIVGDATVTVWQTMSSRIDFARELAAKAAGLMGVLLLTVVVVVWFGVSVGLRPLHSLEEAIRSRSPGDLSTIRRAVPREVAGMVSTLHHLFTRLQKSLADHQSFIADAAHQLRNPATAVLCMAKAAQEAPSEADRQQRINELVDAARMSTRVTEQLLSLGRLQQSEVNEGHDLIELGSLLEKIWSEAAVDVLDRGIAFEWHPAQEPMHVRADELLVSEALKNLLDNALTHGGPGLSRIHVGLVREGDLAKITVANDGNRLSSSDQERAFSRFVQIDTSRGSGLGLAIAAGVADRHGGSLSIDTVDQGASLSLRLPLAV
ncbi:MAG: sensor histidine kinase [Granulosicoccus sp.]|nr:sensor histidine kinase [Granulosicoccus sp.]